MAIICAKLRTNSFGGGFHPAINSSFLPAPTAFHGGKWSPGAKERKKLQDVEYVKAVLLLLFHAGMMRKTAAGKSLSPGIKPETSEVVAWTGVFFAN